MKVLALSLLIAALWIWSFCPHLLPPRLRGPTHTTPSQLASSELCPQFTATTPKQHVLIWDNLLREAVTEEYKEKAVKWLSGAIRIMYVRSLC